MSRAFLTRRNPDRPAAIRNLTPRTAAALRTLPRFERLVYGVVVLWIVTMIGLPIMRWVWGDAALPAGITISVGVQIVAVIVILLHGWGWARKVAVVVLVVSAAWLVEFVGSSTGFPFGVYHYTDKLHPQLGGVPLLIPFAWLMMLPSAWALAYQIVGKRRKVAFVLVSALAFTAWDLFLDPQMVGWGLWIWNDPGAFHFFGIPWVNYAGWLIASALITALALPLLRLEQLPRRPLLILYAITWILETIGQLFFWGLPGPAVVGFMAMGLMLLWTARKPFRLHHE